MDLVCPLEFANVPLKFRNLDLGTTLYITDSIQFSKVSKIFLLSFWVLIINPLYSKTCVKLPLSKRQKIGF